MRALCVVMGLCAMCACTADETRVRGSELGAPGSVASPSVKVEDPWDRLGPKTGGPEAKPVMQVLTPDWALAEKAPRVPDAWTQGLKVKGAAVPVLLPGDEGLVRSAKLTRGEHWYAASMKGDGVSVYIQGSRTSMSFGSVELDAKGEALTRQPYVISRSHQIQTLNFERFGVGYHIDVECAKPMEDPRCADEAYVVSLFEGLAAAGGVR